MSTSILSITTSSAPTLFHQLHDSHEKRPSADLETAQGNPLCAQNGLSGTNQYGANVNFDLCIDSGAAGALFGNSGVGLAVGTATAVSCSQWSGSKVY